MPRTVNLEPRTLTIGTRGSQLALWQANHVAERLRAALAGLSVRLETIKTTGDRILDVPLAAIGGKSLFVKEIEEALLEGRVDLAVHSMKDVPADLPPGLTIAAVTLREDPSDVLISRTGARLKDLSPGARVGTSSLRRQAQLLHHRPDLAVVGLRGNLDTRIRKLTGEGLDAIVVAAAGVKRLGWMDRISEFLSPDVCLPAIGQGALGIEMREPRVESREPSMATIVEVLDHPETHTAVRAERAFLRRLGGGCQVPFAAHAEIAEGHLFLRGLVATPDGRHLLRGERRGTADEGEAVGIALAEDLLARGAREILQAIFRRD
ncbi:MAG: hydroxymethylbilane synthase [candidate division NC10 bacterium]|nr:hydroxymethylbilane synthase [candidate division NC10 bacterium]